MRCGCLLRTSLGAISLAGAVWAQADASLPPGGQSTTANPETPLVRVTTRLVQLNVTAHDHHGKLIPDLTKEDFVVTDQGKEQKIAVFRIESTLSTSGPPAKLMPRNQFSNRLDRQSQIPTAVTVVLIDSLNTPFKDQAHARRQVLQFLRQIRPEDRIALYSMSVRGIRVIHDFTNNSGALVMALARTMPELNRDLTDMERDQVNLDERVDYNSPLEGFAADSGDAEAAFFARDRVLNTCTVMKVLANHLTSISGRKNLVWVSGGFPISFGFGDPAVENPLRNHFSEMYNDYIEDASRAMGSANVAVYPVDARGLLGLPLFDASKQIRMNPRTRELPPEMIHVDHRNFDTMNYLADLTGGKAFYNTNDINGAIRKAIDDSAITYTLGYYTSEEDWDQKFHRIKVKVRRSGVSVRTKKGYYARSERTPSAKELARATYDAVWSPLDASSIGLSAQIDPSPGVPLASRITMLVDPLDLTFKQTPGRLNGSADLIIAQLTKRGKRIADKRETINLALKPETYQAIVKDGLRLMEDVKLGPETESVRLVVVDRGTGAVGTLTMPVLAQDKSGEVVPQH